MNKTQQLNNLFTKWENEIPEYKNKFVRDGIINEDVWDKTNPKILFIAKEPNHYENPQQGDFRLDWNNGNSNYIFAYRIAEWAFGILSGFKIITEIAYNNYLYKEYLQKIAFMNIKKLGGGSYSEHYKLDKHLNFGKQINYLREQINIINPDIVILCLSFNKKFRDMLFPGLNNEVEQCGYHIEVGKINNIKIIDFYHPSSRTVPAASYSLLQNVVQSQTFKNL